jgi:predicted N-formylglutamate amidohydrolase
MSSLLLVDEPPAFECVNESGASPFVLLCDHASRRMPRALGTLGLSDDHLASHIAWDIGAADVARALSKKLDAPLVLSGYSRLAIDCNRPLSVPGRFRR